MLLVKIVCVILSVLAVLFLLSLIVYFFNLDMKAAALLVPVMTKFYDRRHQKRGIGKEPSKSPGSENA